jgi:hypothetical protein
MQLASALKAITAVVFTFAWLGLSLPPLELAADSIFFGVVAVCAALAFTAGWRLSGLSGWCSRGSLVLAAAWFVGGVAVFLSLRSSSEEYLSVGISGILRIATAFALPAGCVIAFATLAASIRRLVDSCRRAVRRESADVR